MSETAKRLQRVKTFLSRWNGGHAEIAGFSASHRSLSIRLWKDGTSGSLELGCTLCRYLAGPTYWQQSELVVAEMKKDSDNSYFVVSDIGCGLLVLCEILEAFERT